MKKVLVFLGLILGWCFPSQADAQVFKLLFRKAHCFVAIQQVPVAVTPVGSATISADLAAQLAKIQAQQEALAVRLDALAQSRQNVSVDPNLAATIKMVADGQDRILAVIQSGNRDNLTALGEYTKQVIAGQDRLLAALHDQTKPVPPPVIVTPPIVSPQNQPNAGSGFVVPGPGGALAATPLPGGALQLTPPPGGSLQAVPGPGGSLQILPGGVAPPKPDKPEGTGVIIQQGPGGTTVTPIPGGSVTPIPGTGSPMIPIPGPGGNVAPVPGTGSSFKVRETTYRSPSK